MLSKGYVILKPIIVIDDKPILKIVSLHCTEAQFLEAVKTKKMEHLYLIPDFYLVNYLKEKGIEATVGELMGGGKIESDEKISATTLLEKTGEAYSSFFLVERVKEIMENYELQYSEFIDAYCAYLKTL